MAVYASLLSSIPAADKQWQTNSNPPAAAAVKVGDITDGGDSSCDGNNTCKGFSDRLKAYLLAKRLKKLENIPQEKRTPAQQAEIEANKQSFNCMI